MLERTTNETSTEEGILHTDAYHHFQSVVYLKILQHDFRFRLSVSFSGENERTILPEHTFIFILPYRTNAR